MSCPLGMELLDRQLSEELIGAPNLKGDTLKDLLKHVKGLKEPVPIAVIHAQVILV